MWNDIENKENTGSVLTKINNLGISIGSRVASLTDYTVEKSAWVKDTTYEDFPYKADIVFEGCTSALIPYVHYSILQQVSGNYIGAVSDTDKVSIWSRKQEAITIPCILLFEGS